MDLLHLSTSYPVYQHNFACSSLFIHSPDGLPLTSPPSILHSHAWVKAKFVAVTMDGVKKKITSVNVNRWGFNDNNHFIFTRQTVRAFPCITNLRSPVCQQSSLCVPGSSSPGACSSWCSWGHASWLGWGFLCCCICSSSYRSTITRVPHNLIHELQ